MKKVLVGLTLLIMVGCSSSMGTISDMEKVKPSIVQVVEVDFDKAFNNIKKNANYCYSPGSLVQYQVVAQKNDANNAEIMIMLGTELTRPDIWLATNLKRVGAKKTQISHKIGNENWRAAANEVTGWANGKTGCR